MKTDWNNQHAFLSWLFVATLVGLAAVLGVLQYGWIDEVSRAESERLRASLHANLLHLSRDFNREITAACAALVPRDLGADRSARERQYAARYEQWKESGPNNRLFRSVSIAVPDGDSLTLRRLDPDKGVFETTEWPTAWSSLKERLIDKLLRRPGGPPPGFVTEDSPDLIELPMFRRPQGGDMSSMRESEWLILQVDLDHVRSQIIPELLQRDLPGGISDYQAAIAMRGSPATLIYQSDPNNKAAPSVEANADGSIRLFEIDRGPIIRSLAPRPRGTGDPRTGPRGPGRRGGPPELVLSDTGRWQLSVRQRAGSVETVVARTRARNLAVMTGILLLMLATVAALVQFTRRAQRLAELQMEFVAGVSHELRTPLTVMRTAGHNLQGKVASDPGRVQRYGALIQSECQKLTSIVEQILRFANINAGRVIGEQQPIAVAGLIDDALEAGRGVMVDSHCVVEKKIASGLPQIAGDPTTLKLALQNLLSNAAKYGTGDWIGLSASMEPDRDRSMIEIRVEDHGAGIPPHEIGKVFDPFYRGKKAILDQIHGTGLGLSLAKRIIEAHHGTLSVRSELGKGTEFLVRIPAAPLEPQYELANSTS